MGADSIQNAVAAIVQGWLDDHPVLGWCVTHPLWAIASLLLFLFLTWGLLRAVARLVETLWIALLRAPIRFSRWIIRRILMLFKLQNVKFLESRPEADSDPSFDQQSLSLMGNGSSQLQGLRAHHSQSDSAEPVQTERSSPQLSDIMVRLERIQKEQIQLLQDVQTLLNSPTVKAESNFPVPKSPPQTKL